MRILRRDRAQSKTRLLVDWMLDKPAARGVIVPNSAQRDLFLHRLYRRMEERGLHDRPIVLNTHWPSLVRTVSSHRMRGETGIEWGIDNLDMLLFDVLGAHVTTATSTETFETVDVL